MRYSPAIREKRIPINLLDPHTRETASKPAYGDDPGKRHSFHAADSDADHHRRQTSSQETWRHATLRARKSHLGPTPNNLKNVDRVERDNAGNPPHLIRIRVSRSQTIGDRSWGSWRNAQRTTRRTLKSDQILVTDRVTFSASASNDHDRPSSVPARRPAKITLGAWNYLSFGSSLFRSQPTRRALLCRRFRLES